MMERAHKLRRLINSQNLLETGIRTPLITEQSENLRPPEQSPFIFRIIQYILYIFCDACAESDIVAQKGLPSTASTMHGRLRRMKTPLRADVRTPILGQLLLQGRIPAVLRYDLLHAQQSNTHCINVVWQRVGRRLWVGIIALVDFWIVVYRMTCKIDLADVFLHDEMKTNEWGRQYAQYT